MTVPSSTGWLGRLGDDGAGDAQVGAINPFNRSAAWPLSTSAVIRIFIVLYHFGPALHLDNTFLENDYRQLSFLA
jgi:hypothetical protein